MCKTKPKSAFRIVLVEAHFAVKQPSTYIGCGIYCANCSLQRWCHLVAITIAVAIAVVLVAVFIELVAVVVIAVISDVSWSIIGKAIGWHYALY